MKAGASVAGQWLNKAHFTAARALAKVSVNRASSGLSCTAMPARP